MPVTKTDSRWTTATRKELACVVETEPREVVEEVEAVIDVCVDVGGVIDSAFSVAFWSRAEPLVKT